MAYVDLANDPRRRATAIIGVTAIHAALGLGLVVGMTIAGVAPKPDVWDPFTLTPDAKPTPPARTPPPTERPRNSETVLPKPPIEVNTVKPNLDSVTGQDKFGDELVTDPRPYVTPAPQPMPSFTPRLARPTNDRSGWISNDDYPSSAIRAEAQGTVGYRLIIGTNGRVSACDITRSSGNRQLDEATCRLIRNRARFEAATDGTGAKVVGTFSGTVLWQIPD